MRELYKYRKFDLRALQMLEEKSIWISSLRRLNDPYEHSFHIEPDMPYEQVAARNPAATRENYKELQQQFIGKLADEFDFGGVYCLSGGNDIGLSWSHYADAHQGFCIGYAVEPGNDLSGGNCYQVSYGGFPAILFSELFQAMETSEEKLAMKVFRTLALSKGSQWSYEKESRMVYMGAADRAQSPNFSISSITFGMRMPQWQRNVVTKLLRDDAGIAYYEARKSAGYQIGIAAL